MALLRVRTVPECPEGNRRELMPDSNLNCGIARDRINLGKALNLGTPRPLPEQKTERSQRRASWLRTSPSPARGRRQGEGERGKLSPRDGIPYQMANRLPASNQRLLRFWMVDICREGRSQKSASQKGHKAHRTSTTRN